MNPLPDSLLDDCLAFAVSAADEAGRLALRYFQQDLAVEWKADNSPVTIADRECETLLRQRIEQRYPDHGILGEEFGAARPGAGWRWLLDPIDGTQTFIRGVPLWGVMIGLEREGDPVLGVVHFPALRETVSARRDGGARWNGRPARVSNVSRLEEATLLCTDPRGYEDSEKREGFRRLQVGTRFERTWGDCYGHILVATGRAEVMLDPVLHEWDACALIPILEEAGGQFVDWNGARTARGASGISTNAALAGQVLRILRPSGQSLP